MKLKLENVGVIEKADIELNGITLITGWNSSGKTTINRAIYSSINDAEVQEGIELEYDTDCIKVIQLDLDENKHTEVSERCIYSILNKHKIDRSILGENYTKSTRAMQLIAIKRVVESNDCNENTILLIDELGMCLGEKSKKALAEILVSLQKTTGVYIVANTYVENMLEAIKEYSCEYGILEKLNIYETEKIGDNRYTVKNITEDI